MRPLDPIAGSSTVEQLLRSAPPPEVRLELGRLERLELRPAQVAARHYAAGALALRDGQLDEAVRSLDRAADELGKQDEPEAAALARAEAWLARLRRGPRSVFGDAAAALEQLAAALPDSRLVQVVTLHYRGTAQRYAGQAEATLRVLLDAFARSEGLLAERAQILNSLGTLYVVLGAYGAAHAVLEHAAELNHQVGDRVGEAISYGQLGSAALALGELETARGHLQRQEWLAGKIGDAFGRARALTLLGDLAIDMGRPDDALLLGEQARTLATSVTPPLGMWVAYSSRTIARAKLELQSPDALTELEAARERFRKLGNQLGEAMADWDLARHASRSKAGDADAKEVAHRWFHTAMAFANLGLTGREAQVLRELRALATDSAARRSAELAVAAASQAHPHLASAQEVELVYHQPDLLAEIATRRIEGQRNLGRLAALTLAGRGLVLGVLASSAIGSRHRAIPTRRCSAALVGQLPGAATWAWSKGATAAEIARDAASLRAACGDDTRAALGWFPAAKLEAAPFAGELGGLLVGADVSALTAAALNAQPAALLRGADLPWDADAEGLVRLAGFEPSTELG